MDQFGDYQREVPEDLIKAIAQVRIASLQAEWVRRFFCSRLLLVSTSTRNSHQLCAGCVALADTVTESSGKIRIRDLFDIIEAPKSGRFIIRTLLSTRNKGSSGSNPSGEASMSPLKMTDGAEEGEAGRRMWLMGKKAFESRMPHHESIKALWETKWKFPVGFHVLRRLLSRKRRMREEFARTELITDELSSVLRVCTHFTTGISKISRVFLSTLSR